MKHANGAGIAAPQIGEPWRVFVVHGTGNNPRYPYKPAIPLTVFVNPEIEVLDPTPMHMIEGCLSVPGMRGKVSRAAKVRCRALRPDGTPFVLRAEGHAAGTLQHELDHLNGTLFPDLASSDGLMTWDSFDEHHKSDFFKYAAEINRLYPTPLTWELGGPEDSGNGNVGSAFELNKSSQVEVKDSSKSTASATSGRASPVVTYKADLTWVNSSFQPNVYVTVTDGKITNITTDKGIGSDSDVVTLPGVALTPGFVNAHSHAFQRALRGRGETYPTSSTGEAKPSFWTWRNAMYSLVNDLDSVEAFKQQTKQCFVEMASSGITTCGEFHYFRHSKSSSEEDYAMDNAVVEAAREANVRLVLLSACYQRGGFDNRPLNENQQRFKTASMDRYLSQLDNLSAYMDGSFGEGIGIVVHSLRAVDVPTLQKLSREANTRKIPLHIHIEEQPLEIEDCLTTHGVTPMRLLLDSLPRAEIQNICAVHCTHSDSADLKEFIEAGGKVCICPLTEASLGDGVFKSLECTKGVVSLGSDCNARIDMFEEMRWLEYSQRLQRGQRGVFASVSENEKGELANQLFACATEHGAHHLGVNAGTLAVGKWADFCLLNLSAPALKASTVGDLMGAAVFGGSSEGLVVDTCVAGKWTKKHLQH
eukprot:CAMPEP_0185030836 /NCGR_PEP_ID=MMETSP1103-20130426/17918_1 /TAXON_ID=36769 /ORGANISM="Paraphysomonas bandaiensis, Strain Caron Lab Isolate" /LENGTH=646 /DNA_ID=CAMNT_0027566107 /DNA_START=102 /DNA_END=2042 /DNA_ORIENTATION=+